jgi:hypothetical protein
MRKIRDVLRLKAGGASGRTSVFGLVSSISLAN